MLNGPRVKQIIMILFLATIFCAYTFGSPYYAAYSARPIVRRACNGQIQEDRRKDSPQFRTTWENRFMSSLRSEGIFVDSDQFAFTIEKTKRGRRASYTCNGQLKFALDNPWIPDFGFFDAPTFRTIHVVDETVEYNQ